MRWLKYESERAMMENGMSSLFFRRLNVATVSRTMTAVFASYFNAMSTPSRLRYELSCPAYTSVTCAHSSGTSNVSFSKSSA